MHVFQVQAHISNSKLRWVSWDVSGVRMGEIKDIQKEGKTQGRVAP